MKRMDFKFFFDREDNEYQIQAASITRENNNYEDDGQEKKEEGKNRL